MDNFQWSGRVTCDTCGAEFLIEIKVDHHADGGELHYFVCPHCHHRYPVADITAHGVQLREQMDRIRSTAGHNHRWHELADQLAPEITRPAAPAQPGEQDEA